MGEDSPVDTPKPGKVAGSSGNRQLALEGLVNLLGGCLGLAQWAVLGV
jgi:hypothetical protein